MATLLNEPALQLKHQYPFISHVLKLNLPTDLFRVVRICEDISEPRHNVGVWNGTQEAHELLCKAAGPLKWKGEA